MRVSSMSIHQQFENKEKLMKPEVKKYTTIVGGKEFIFETGNLAGQAGGSVTVRYGDSQVFCAATMSEEPRLGINFFPLSVDYEERMYAGGKIPGSFFRREGRPNEGAVLTARLTDRPLRPLFPKDMRNDVQVIIYAFAADGKNPLDILAINSASIAVTISDIPWDGPIGAVRIGLINDEFVVNPSFEELEESTLDLRVAGTKDAILMVEAGSDEVPEEVMVKALERAHLEIQPLVAVQEVMALEIGKQKRDYPRFATPEERIETIQRDYAEKMLELLKRDFSKQELKDAEKNLKNEAVEVLANDDEEEKKEVLDAFDVVYKKVVRERILNEGIRPDGRQIDQIRDIWSETNFSPIAHGSGLFNRGETQVLTLATLGTPRDAQSLDNLTPTEEKRYMHHYNFPPFSVGETRFLRGASRREIGHGALAERALLPVIPPESEFPYTMRLVSEVLSSNGSTSMASVCASTLALMDTGVPITSPVAGIAMGLIKGEDNHAVLTDIQGLEDHLGDMDFKVAGTKKGITALQMDIKIKGISTDIMASALEQAKRARFFIMDKMLEVIAEPRTELKPHVPRIVTVKIPVDKIGAVIGPGGKTIRSIQEDTGAKIDIAEDGTVFIATSDQESALAAQNLIETLTEEPEVGRIYTGKVVGVKDFGAFVEILPGTDGMVHVSQLDTQRVNKVSDVVNVGDEITVMIIDMEKDGKIRLSRQAVLEGWTAEEAIQRDRANRSSKRSNKGGRGRHRN